MKKEKLKTFHREAIASVAHHLFMEQGLANTTMDEIAKEADYSKATIYTYFKSKDEIFYYNALQGWQLLFNKITMIQQKNTDTISAYYQICEAVVNLYEEYPIYFASLLKTISSNQKERVAFPILEEIYQIGEELNKVIIQLLLQGEEEQILKKNSANLETAVMLWASLTGIISFVSDKEEYLLRHISKSKREYLTYCFELLLQSILEKEH